VTSIAAVRVQARTPRPLGSLGADARAGTDAGDKSVDGAAAALSPDQRGDLVAMAAAMPGLSTIGGGMSAFGLSEPSNSRTFKGLAFGGNESPREARTAVHYRPSPGEPRIWGFSGVQSEMSLGPGNNVTSRTGRVTPDAPGLQLTDPVSARSGQRYANVALDEGGVGALLLDRLYYNIGMHAARRTAPVRSLANLDPTLLARAGISSDSAVRALALAHDLGMPIGSNADGSSRTTTTLSFIERIDRGGVPATSGSAPGPTLALTGFGKFQETQGISLSPTTLPMAAARSRNTLCGIQGLYTRYFGNDGRYVSETTSGLSFSSARTTHTAMLSAADVLIASDIGVGTLSSAGGGIAAAATRAWSWETINQTSFLLQGRESLPRQVYVQSRFDELSNQGWGNSSGRYRYASLAGFATNSPSSYARNMSASTSSVGEWTGAAALAATWNRNNLSLTGGTRVDVNAFTASPVAVPQMQTDFGVRSDHPPSCGSLSPLVGFVWRYTPTRGYLFLNDGDNTVARGQAQCPFAISVRVFSTAARLSAMPI
jgi:hypothetical protein